MDNILDFIEKYKFAIVGTVLFHIGVFAYANFSTLKRPFKMVDPEVEITMPLEDIIIDPEMMELMDMDPKEVSSEELYNLSADQNDTREMSFEEFSTHAIDENVNKSVEELEQEYKDYWASQHDGADISTSVKGNEDEKDDKTLTTQSEGANIQNKGDKAFAGRVMVSYNLKDRKAFSLPVPGYMCNGAGVVVISIKVDKNGAVKSTTYNAGNSRGATDCMIEKALQYANKSRFNLENSSNTLQDGTITYEFQGQ